MRLLPGINGLSEYHYPDGCRIQASSQVSGKWRGWWADRTPLRGCCEQTGMEVTSYFASAEAVAQALADGGEGPASTTHPMSTAKWQLQ